MPFQRASGIILHPTSLPSPFGMGDLGQAAYEFVDFLADTGQQIWQLLPLGPTGHGNSPYMCYSAMAGNPMLISLADLEEQGLLAAEDLEGMDHFPADQVDYGAVMPARQYRLEKAAAAFRETADAAIKQAFQTFCDERAFWLNDYAFFMALKQAHNGASWHQWDRAIACREPEAKALSPQQLAVPHADQKI